MIKAVRRSSDQETIVIIGLAWGNEGGGKGIGVMRYIPGNVSKQSGFIQKKSPMEREIGIAD